MKLTIAVVFLAASTAAAAASPITYTYSGTFSGSLGGTSFTDKATTVSGTADTTTIVSFSGGGLLRNPLTFLSITISDTGNALFSGNNSIFSTDLGPALSVNGTTLGTGVDFLDGSRFLSTVYDLKSNLGPLQLSLLNGGSVTAATTSGPLLLTGTRFPLTFVAQVPEPRSLMLLIPALATALLLASRKRPDTPSSIS